MTKSLLLRLPVVHALLLGGCDGAVWGNLLVLMVTVGVFAGTLSLGRTRTPGPPPKPQDPAQGDTSSVSQG
jgi:hypothetical protein